MQMFGLLALAEIPELVDDEVLGRLEVDLAEQRSQVYTFAPVKRRKAQRIARIRADSP